MIHAEQSAAAAVARRGRIINWSRARSLLPLAGSARSSAITIKSSRERDFSFSQQCARDPLAEAPDRHKKKDCIHWGDLFLSLCAPDIKYKRRAFLLYSLAQPAERAKGRPE